MLVGGKDGSTGDWVKNTMFLSLNPSLGPLPSCLGGTKNDWDAASSRKKPALIMRDGELKNQVLFKKKCRFLSIIRGQLAQADFHSHEPLDFPDGKPLVCAGVNNNKECHSYEARHYL